MRILLVSGESSVARIARSLKSANDVSACICGVRSATNRSLQNSLDRIGVACWHSDSLTSDSLPRRMYEAEIDILISFRCPKILPESVLNAPKIGAFNLHTGPLPEYAGLNAPSWAIFNGEDYHGCTLHWMDPGIDTGNIVSASRIPISDSETGISLTGKCVEAGVNLIAELVSLIRRGEAIPTTPQDPSSRVYYSKAVPNSGVVDWSWDSAKIERFVRASYFHPFTSPWGTPAACVNGRIFGILSGRAIQVISGEPGTIAWRGENYLDIATGKGIMRILEVVTDGQPSTVEELGI
ncbi:MAG: formyltransferase family protein [Candidatus Accumulibacter meliphilus]|uniref:methionyl-tRNA formyltransferase n=1 Tax=Candidatus Accumulibacter meliphilus TaxID=2211374 RepID=UPI002FC386E1